jgi:hypothetical protein
MITGAGFFKPRSACRSPCRETYEGRRVFSALLWLANG